MNQSANYHIEISPAIKRVIPDYFLSFTIDISLVIGGRWWGASKGLQGGLSIDTVAPLDLGNAQLIRMARLLTPARVRIGGTEADRIVYGFRKEQERLGLVTTPVAKKGSHANPFVLGKGLWKRISLFAKQAGLGLVFTVGAGPELRDAAGNWVSHAAARLVSWAARNKSPVVAWEFGNEVNAFPFLFGLRHGVSAGRYAREFGNFAKVVRAGFPTAALAGPAAAIWPVIGEAHPVIPTLCRSREAAEVDVLSFHYYPQQSDRGRIAIRRAGRFNILNPRALDGLSRWIRYIRRAEQQGCNKETPIWLTECGHALYGGQSGVSDTALSVPWWIDQLGLAAHEGVSAVFRQSLVGGDYGLLDPVTFEPRPDFFASFLWKQLMGGTVYEKPFVQGSDHKLRVWHHSLASGKRGSCLALINLNHGKQAVFTCNAQARGFWILEVAMTDGFALTINGKLPQSDFFTNWKSDYRSKPEVGEVLSVPPLSVAFVVLADVKPPE